MKKGYVVGSDDVFKWYNRIVYNKNGRPVITPEGPEIKWEEYCVFDHFGRAVIHGTKCQCQSENKSA